MSALPGINDTQEVASFFDNTLEPQRLSIPQGSQWVIDLPTDAKLSLKVLSGIAEIFGTELVNDIEYKFENFKFSVEAVEEVEMEWKCAELSQATLDIRENTTAKNIYNLHFALEKLRASNFEGPCVMVIGGSSTGKTSLCRTLCSYAIKQKPYQPLYVNLNPTDGIFSVPGCLTATPISDILDVKLPSWGQSMTSGATALHGKQPLVKCFGLENIEDNKSLYMEKLRQLSSTSMARVQNDPIVKRSGIFIDTPPLDRLSDSNTELQSIMEQFNVNVVLMLRGTSDSTQVDVLKESLKHHPITFLEMPKLSGTITVDDVFKRALARSAIRDYFYGSQGAVLSPYTVGVDYEDITIWQPSDRMNTSEEELTQEQAVMLRRVEINASNLQHALVAITYVDRKATAEEVQLAPLLGFGLITEVNEKKRKLRFLLPVPGHLPSKALVLTSYRYLE